MGFQTCGWEARRRQQAYFCVYDRVDLEAAILEVEWRRGSSQWEPRAGSGGMEVWKSSVDNEEGGSELVAGR